MHAISRMPVRSQRSPSINPNELSPCGTMTPMADREIGLRPRSQSRRSSGPGQGSPFVQAFPLVDGQSKDAPMDQRVQCIFGYREAGRLFAQRVEMLLELELAGWSL